MGSDDTPHQQDYVSVNVHNHMAELHDPMAHYGFASANPFSPPPGSLLRPQHLCTRAWEFSLSLEFSISHRMEACMKHISEGLSFSDMISLWNSSPQAGQRGGPFCLLSLSAPFPPALSQQTPLTPDRGSSKGPPGSPHWAQRSGFGGLVMVPYYPALHLN